MKNLCIIPARGGSKRIPRKNIKPFMGKPIIAYSIEAALNSGVFDEVMVSTDDEEFAELYFKDFESEIKKHPIYEEYFDSLLSKRNEDWAVKIADYLEEPGVTFIFAGCAHFVGSESVFAYMNQNGTLEY